MSKKPQIKPSANKEDLLKFVQNTQEALVETMNELESFTTKPKQEGNKPDTEPKRAVQPSKRTSSIRLSPQAYHKLRVFAAVKEKTISSILEDLINKTIPVA